MATVTITLTRAHKLAERLKQKANELRAEASGLAQNQRVTGAAGEQTVARFREQGRRAMEALLAADRCSEALASLRAQIGAENERRGISAKLAELEHINRMMAARKAMIPARSETSISPDELQSYAPLAADFRNLSGQYFVEVAVLSAEAVQQITAEVASLQRTAFQLSDHIAEANAARFSVSLEDDILAEVTGQ